MNKLAALAVAAALAFGAVPAQSALVNLGNGTVKDTSANLIWEFDWSSARVNWWEATDWADSLELGGASDWKLPSVDEFISLWQALDQYDDPLAILDIFANVDPTYGYWTRDESGDTAMLFWPAISPSGMAVTLVNHFKWGAKSAVAVRLPEPATWPLALTALGALFALSGPATRAAATPPRSPRTRRRRPG